MAPMLGTTELLIVLAIVLLLFGGSRVGKLGSELGAAIANFRKGLREAEITDEKAGPEKPDDNPS